MLLAALIVGACSSVAPPKPTPTVHPAAPAPAPVAAAPAPVPALPPAPPAAPSAAEQRTALAGELAVEQQWLASWFGGTPVQIRQQNDGALTVDVPREFCFDAGRFQVKPPLAAVLDKVAESLRRRPTAYVAILAAPDDQPGSTPLALKRASQLQKHLRERGVAAARMGEPKAAAGAAVQLRIVAAPT